MRLRSEQQQLANRNRRRSVRRARNLHEPEKFVRLVVEDPALDCFLRADRELAPADPPVIELRRRRRVSRTAVAELVNLFERREAKRQHRQNVGQRVIPRRRHILEAPVDELGDCDVSRILARRLDAPLDLTNQHLDREQHRPDGGVVVAHLFENLNAAPTVKLREKLFVDPTAELL